MTHFILVPGAMHGAWTWDRVTPLLIAAGHTVTALDLPGMGAQPSVAPGEVTLEMWGDFVAGAVRDAGQPVLLAGHSRGGLVIGEAAERVPDMLIGLIYVTALIVPPGRCGFEVAGSETTERADPIWSEDRASSMLRPETAKALFYQRCTEKDAKAAAARLCLEPMRPNLTPASVTWERWGRVPRAYIGCRDDRLLTPARQHVLQAAAPCDPVIEIDADHSPFLSAPEALAKAMLAIERRFDG